MSNISTRTLFIMAAAFGLAFAIFDTLPGVQMPLTILLLLAATFGMLTQFKADKVIPGLRLGALLNLTMGAALLPAVAFGTNAKLTLLNPLTYITVFMLASMLISVGAIAATLTALVRKINNRQHEKSFSTRTDWDRRLLVSVP
jgi:lipoprotein signal peptidase